MNSSTWIAIAFVLNLAGMLAGFVTVIFRQSCLGHPGLCEISPGVVTGPLGVVSVSCFGGARTDAVNAPCDRLMRYCQHHGHREWTQPGGGNPEIGADRPRELFSASCPRIH